MMVTNALLYKTDENDMYNVQNDFDRLALCRAIDAICTHLGNR